MGRHISVQCFGTPASATTLLLRGQARLCSVLYCTFGYLLCCVLIIHCYWSIQVLRPNYIYKFMTLPPKEYYLILGNGTKNLLRPNYIYKFMTLLPNNYYLIPDNGAKNLLRPNYIYKFMTLLPKDYYLIPDNGAKNLLRPNCVCDVIIVCQTSGTTT